jgi:radical SAM protein with 4Fe4S-binding SPASM domain
MHLNEFLEQREKGRYDYPLVRLQVIQALNFHPDMNAFIREWIDKVDVIYLKKLEGMRQVLGDTLLKADMDTPRKPCKQLYYTLSVNWNGTIAYCCHDPEGKSIIGDIHEITLQSAWQDNLRMREQRNMQEHGAYQGLCRECVDWGNW